MSNTTDTKPNCYRLKKNLLLPDGNKGARYKEGDFVYAQQITVREEFLSENPDWFEPIPSYLVPAESYERLFEQLQQLMEEKSTPQPPLYKELTTEEIRTLIRSIADGAKGYDTKKYLNCIVNAAIEEKQK